MGGNILFSHRLGTVRVGFAGRREARQRARLVGAHEAGVAEAAKTAASLRSMDAPPEYARGSPVPGAILRKAAGKAERCAPLSAALRGAGPARGGQRGSAPGPPR